MSRSSRTALLFLALASVCGFGTGCRVCPPGNIVAMPDMPRELAKVTFDEYIIEPPDILQINAVQLIPRPPYRVQSLDTLAIQVANSPPTAPIGGLYVVDPDGTVNLGPQYGTVKVVGLTLAEAKEAIQAQLRNQLKEPEASVSVAQSRALQQIAGEHLVRTDGTVSLGAYGNVPVTGLTLSEAKRRIEAHLTQFLESPEVTVDVAAYNSKVFYVIFDGGGYGQQVYRLPVTGNDTVLDAISQVNGLGPVSDQHQIWVARPAPSENACDQVLPVDWVGVTTKGRTGTNYQLMPGDRVYVKAMPLVTLDATLGRVLAPVERILGVTLLGTNTYNQISGRGLGTNFR